MKVMTKLNLTSSFPISANIIDGFRKCGDYLYKPVAIF